MQRPFTLQTLQSFAVIPGAQIDQATDRICATADVLPALDDTERADLPDGPTADELGLFRVTARLLAERPALQQATGYEPQLLQHARDLDQALTRVSLAGVAASDSAQAGALVLGATAAHRNSQIAQAVEALKQDAPPAEATALDIVFDVSEIILQDTLDRAKAARGPQQAQPLEDRLAYAQEQLDRQKQMHQLMAQDSAAS